MPEQLPKKIFNLISDRSTQLESLNAYAKAIQAVSGKIPAYILEDLIESLKSFNSDMASLELELGNNGYSFDDLAHLTAMVNAAEKDKRAVGGCIMKTLGIYIWYFFAESEIFPKILIAASLIILGMFLERAW